MEIPESNGMSFLENVPSLEDPKDEGNIVIRNLTKPMWQAVIERVNTPNERVKVALIGTPGTGKSTTTAVLIRMLLEKEKTVVYRFMGRPVIFEMKPDLDKKIVQVTCHQEPERESKLYKAVPSLRETTAYYIVDPGDTQQNCNPTTDVLAKVIIVASPNPLNWGGENFSKELGSLYGIFMYHPLWTVNEIVKAFPYIRHDSSLTKDDLEVRYRRVGGVPRHIFSKKYVNWLQKQSAAFGYLSKEPASRIARKEIDQDEAIGRTQSALVGYVLREATRETTGRLH